MGNYTKFKADLVIHTEHSNVIDIIESLLTPTNYIGESKYNRPKKGMPHSFFLAERASKIFSDMDMSYTHFSTIDPEEIKRFLIENPNLEFSDHEKMYGKTVITYIDKTTFNKETGELNIRASFKNYDNEIYKFINWIYPYLDLSKTDKTVVLNYDNDIEDSEYNISDYYKQSHKYC